MTSAEDGLPEVTFVVYEVKNKGHMLDDDPPRTTLEDAVDAYRPDATLHLVVGDWHEIVDVPREMTWLHRDLLHLAEALVSDGNDASEDRVHRLVLDDRHECVIVDLIPGGEIVSAWTMNVIVGRDSFGIGRLANTEDCVTGPVRFARNALICNIHEFLRRYLDDLVEVDPNAFYLRNFQDYSRRLTAVAAANAC